MRITREMLLKIAADAIAQRVKADNGILAAYLHGSLLEGGEPLLGGAADIDLTFVHIGLEGEREIVRMSDEVTLDINHHARAGYEPPRALRQHPWLGPTAFYAKPLHDPQHFLDFTQAGVRGMYDEPENVLGRTEPLLAAARLAWLGFPGRIGDSEAARAREYLAALENAANAVAGLNGPLLTIRRLLLDYPARAEAAGQPGLATGLVGLLGGLNVRAADVKAMLPAWEAAYRAQAQAGNSLADLHPQRRAYYQRAILALAEGGPPGAALWPLLRTWTDAVCALPPGGEHELAWRDALTPLGLAGSGFEDRLTGLDAYLDRVEELFEGWKRERGV
ncbi:MAG: hypothetical protein HYZ26_08885 [Chloroflexi bacterium]|nr:hypothetical protein [Chloroflexota bacterium]